MYEADFRFNQGTSRKIFAIKDFFTLMALAELYYRKCFLSNTRSIFYIVPMELLFDAQFLADFRGRVLKQCNRKKQNRLIRVSGLCFLSLDM